MNNILYNVSCFSHDINPTKIVVVGGVGVGVVVVGVVVGGGCGGHGVGGGGSLQTKD